MEQVSVKENYKPKKWYNREIFPLVPIFETRKANSHNSKWFSFSWLIFKFWSLDSFGFQLAFNLDVHWGFGITFILPYLRGVICIPCPYWLEKLIYKYLDRGVKY